MNVRVIYVLSGIITLFLLSLLFNEKWMIPCILHQLTGWDCPFCGGQRMICALFHADFTNAFLYNPFLMCSFPLFSIWLVHYLFPIQIQSIRYLSIICTDRTFFIYLLAALVWGLIRNL